MLTDALSPHPHTSARLTELIWRAVSRLRDQSSTASGDLRDAVSFRSKRGSWQQIVGPKYIQVSSPGWIPAIDGYFVYHWCHRLKETGVAGGRHHDEREREAWCDGAEAKTQGTSAGTSKVSPRGCGAKREPVEHTSLCSAHSVQPMPAQTRLSKRCPKPKAHILQLEVKAGFQVRKMIDKPKQPLGQPGVCCFNAPWKFELGQRVR